MPGFKDCNENDASKSFESDKIDHGYQIVNDKVITKIVAEVEPSQ